MVDDQASNDCAGNCIRGIFFFNPLTKAKILMPSRLQCEGTVAKIVASTKPSDPNCVVACLFDDANMLALSGISDESWTLIKGSHQKENIIFKDIEILDGKLYALNHPMFDTILVCDLQNKPIKPKLLAAENPLAEVDDLVDQSDIVDPTRYLAIDASSGELLLIYLFEELLISTGLLPTFIGSKVFKFNFTTGREEGEWIKVNDLGNRMLFVGGGRSLVVSNVGLHGPQDLIEDNCIYFTSKIHIKGIFEEREFMSIGRYSESDKKMDYYTSKSLIPSNVFSSVWFMPSFW